VREGRAMTAKELEDLENLFHVFKGHVEALEAMTAPARPDAAKELMSLRGYIELMLPSLRRGDLPGEAVAKITSMRHRVNKLRGSRLRLLAVSLLPLSGDSLGGFFGARPPPGLELQRPPHEVG